jgi:hypothetical protein
VFTLTEHLDAVAEIFRSVPVECEQRVLTQVFAFWDNFQVKDHLMQPGVYVQKDEWLCNLFSSLETIYPDFLRGDKFPLNK